MRQNNFEDAKNIKRNVLKFYCELQWKKFIGEIPQKKFAKTMPPINEGSV